MITRSMLPAFLNRSPRTRGRRKKLMRCRRWLENHRWDCGGAKTCKGNHRCVLCGGVGV